ncbi:hypothetical protein ACFVFH_27760 [Streptomyces sp. NPDC057697]|uniref:hypothetical protein n=1 Tax=Streptomyces sp. NPDC057697 TaxID=3346219 RepID=UPI003699A683
MERLQKVDGLVYEAPEHQQLPGIGILRTAATARISASTSWVSSLSSNSIK